MFLYVVVDVTEYTLSGWWFQRKFLFSPLQYFGEDSDFDSYFSNGLKPPSSCGNLVVKIHLWSTFSEITC